MAPVPPPGAFSCRAVCSLIPPSNPSSGTVLPPSAAPVALLLACHGQRGTVSASILYERRRPTRDGTTCGCLRGAKIPALGDNVGPEAVGCAYSTARDARSSTDCENGGHLCLQVPLENSFPGSWDSEGSSADRSSPVVMPSASQSPGISSAGIINSASPVLFVGPACGEQYSSPGQGLWPDKCLY
ncbi:hypothetical protein BTVI_158680 [Pitangus sulphuratus]|nr:hypothetical protein BTVI_158680 [Pitangus sulphuratus]